MTICGECAGWVSSLTMIVGCFGIYKHSDFTCYLWFGLNWSLKKNTSPWHNLYRNGRIRESL